MPADVYATAFTAARHEARTWRPDGPRLGYRVPWWNHAWPGCDLGALLQRLTIDAESADEVRVRLQAAADGFAAEGRCLALPDLGSDELAEIGPRLSPGTIARLRQLVCPTTAAALTLALATDSDARALASHRRESGTDLIALPAGAYRLPVRVQPILSAATLEHIGRHPAASLFAQTGKLRIGAPRLAHLIARGAALAGLPTPVWNDGRKTVRRPHLPKSAPTPPPDREAPVLDLVSVPAEAWAS